MSIEALIIISLLESFFSTFDPVLEAQEEVFPESLVNDA
jgi:hypothetical protein